MKAPMPDGRPLLVSACLTDVPCRYDGKSSAYPRLGTALSGFHVVPVCPEQLGGLPTPRPPASFTSGDGRGVLDGNTRLVNTEGADVTDCFKRGAYAALEVAQDKGAEMALFKDRSPSCGVTEVHSGGVIISGVGVTTALLHAHGIAVMGIEDFLTRVQPNGLAG